MTPARRSCIPWRFAAAIVLPALLAGCVTKVPQREKPAGYFGPTEPMAAVIAQINANNQQIRSLWARTSFVARIVDPDQRVQNVSGDGYLLYRKARDLRLRGSKPGVTVFDLGSNAERYWVVAPDPGPNRMWWGYHRNAGKPCAEAMPIRPDLILEVLGVGDIASDLLQEPAPTMRFNNDADAYVFVWSRRGSEPDRWIAQREIWYDRATRRPQRVLLYDDNGRVVLRAQLSEPRPVEMPGVPVAQRPVVAAKYQILFPDSGSQIELELVNVELTHNGLPRDISFQFPQDTDIPRDRIIQIDEHCGS